MNDISLFESKTNTYLERNRIPKVENLRTWIYQHPSYELVKPSIKKKPIQQSKPKVKPIESSTTNILPMENIRRKVSTDFYDRIVMRFKLKNEKSFFRKSFFLFRLEKNGDRNYVKSAIVKRVNDIESEMFRVNGNTDTAYRHKYRSIIANISNLKNDVNIIEE